MDILLLFLYPLLVFFFFSGIRTNKRLNQQFDELIKLNQEILSELKKKSDF